MRADPAAVLEAIDQSLESMRVMELLGRVAVLPEYRDLEADEANSLAAEAAYESWREAVAAEWGLGGLVSVPTSDTRRVFRKRSGLIARATEEALRDHLDAFEIGTDAGRIARLRRAVGFTARVHCTEVDLSARCCMVTLTYREDGEWQPRHITEFVKVVRQHLARRDVRFRYCWVAELTKRGRIHYHLALWLPADVNLPKPDQAGWWTHGSTRIEVARNAVPYLMKYLSKGSKASDYALPLGARSYGCGGLGQVMRLARRWLSLPGFIQARADVATSAGWRRAPGGGWSDPDGTIWPSEFRRVGVGAAWCLERVCNHGRPLRDVGGPFSFLPGVA